MGDSSDLEIICLTNMKVESPPVVERERTPLSGLCLRLQIFSISPFSLLPPLLLLLHSLQDVVADITALQDRFRLKVSALDKIGALDIDCLEFLSLLPSLHHHFPTNDTHNIFDTQIIT